MCQNTRTRKYRQNFGRNMRLFRDLQQRGLKKQLRATFFLTGNYCRSAGKNRLIHVRQG